MASGSGGASLEFGKFFCRSGGCNAVSLEAVTRAGCAEDPRTPSTIHSPANLPVAQPLSAVKRELLGADCQRRAGAAIIDVDICTYRRHHDEVAGVIAGFDWDDGNRGKCAKHGVSADEVESLFKGPIMILPDEAQSAAESRLKAIGKTASGRYIFLVFTVRKRKDERYIRPISARYIHRREVLHYEKENPNV